MFNIKKIKLFIEKVEKTLFTASQSVVFWVSLFSSFTIMYIILFGERPWWWW